MLVDSSVWIDFLHARSTPQTDYLRSSLVQQRIYTADLVVTEVLQGTRDARAFGIAQDVLLSLDVITVVGPQIAVQAARNYQFLRGKGITVRKVVDTLLATRCIEDRMPLLFADRDFDPFVEHLGLKSAMRYPYKVN